MITTAEFFIKYPSVDVCWKSQDDQLHFNECDADLHNRMNGQTAKPVKITREGETKKTTPKS